MTGKSADVGHTGRSLGTSGIAVLAAGSMLAALGLSACSPGVASATTVLRGPRAATVVLAGGAQRAGVDGMTVPKGATVHTEPGGSAALVAAGRTVLLGSQTAVTVVDGGREQLRQGLVMVDARRSPGLSLDAGAASVRTPRGGLARVERGALLRAASFRKKLTVRATGRKASAPVDALHQVQVPDGGLPGRVTPLALTRDSWERRYALDLVTADADLSALADGLDRDAASGSAVLHAVPSSYSTSAVPGEPRSETALAYVVASAAKGNGVALFEDIRGWREDGGSWGVVAALAGADVAAVSAALDAILSPTSAPVLAVGGGPVSTVGAVVAPQPQVGTTDITSPGPRVSSTGRPKPRPSPSPSDPVQQVVTTVTDLLPTPTPTPILVLPTAAPIRVLPSASPLLSVNVGGLGVNVP